MAAVVAVRNLHKSYGFAPALQGVSLTIRPGTVHALVGGNGAGKSTLVKIITGAISPDSGSIEIGEMALLALTPRLARNLGISVIHQDRQIALDLSVTENILLGALPRKWLALVNWSEAHRQAERLVRRVGLDLDVRQPVRHLSVAELQGVEIARSLSARSRLVVMDEPTSALSGSNISRLQAIIRSLRDSGIAVLYISHHLEELREVADEVTVLRDGRVVTTQPAEDLATEELIRLMLGRELSRATATKLSVATRVRSDTVAVDVAAVHCAPGLHGVSFRAHAGEVVCITGGIGSGRRELARCLAGVSRPQSGRIYINGHEVRGPRSGIRRGVVFLPEDRKREGLLFDLNVADNIVIGELGVRRNPFVWPARLRRQAATIVKRLGIKPPSPSTPVRYLSGGNQQKVMLGRWLGTGAQAFVFDEPTAGVDIGTKIEIYELLQHLAQQGAVLVLFSSDYEEIKFMADRVIVLRKGVVAGVLTGGDIDEEHLLSLELGAA
jgi:ABC-type sugar transport system ATPase subunit